MKQREAEKSLLGNLARTQSGFGLKITRCIENGALSLREVDIWVVGHSHEIDSDVEQEYEMSAKDEGEANTQYLESPGINRSLHYISYDYDAELSHRRMLREGSCNLGRDGGRSAQSLLNHCPRCSN